MSESSKTRLTRFSSLPIQFTHIARLTQLPLIHNDPFDRMLIAQAQAEGLTLITRDDIIPRYDVLTVRA